MRTRTTITIETWRTVSLRRLSPDDAEIDAEDSPVGVPAETRSDSITPDPGTDYREEEPIWHIEKK